MAAILSRPKCVKDSGHQYLRDRCYSSPFSWIDACNGVCRVCHLCKCWIDSDPWWRHQMETFSALLALCEGNSPVTGEFPSQGQWRGASVFSLICVWINGWVNNREAGDLRRHGAHCDVSVMRVFVWEMFPTCFKFMIKNFLSSFSE